MAVLNGGRIGIASQALGIASGAYELALKYAKKEKLSVQKLSITKQLLSNWQIWHQITAARMLCYKAAVKKMKEKIFLKVVQWQNYMLLK
jgi:alkylation response protein AidB-like acyl-CoA dehydrogenase